MTEHRDPFMFLFAETSYAADDSVADMFAAFGVTPPGTEAPPAQGETEGEGSSNEEEPKKKKKPEESEPATPEAAPATEEDDGEDPEEPPAPAPKPNQAAEAFARMRIQNKQYETMLGQIAGVLGVKDTSNPEQMMAALQQMVLQAQSKASGIPEEVLRETRETKAELEQLRQEQLRGQALLSFQRVKDTYQLSNDQLSAFADKLLENGRNPFTTPMDLLAEYKMLYFEDIVEAERKKAAKAEAERLAKARDHSTQPTTKDGKSSGDPAKISTVRDFTDWLDKQA